MKFRMIALILIGTLAAWLPAGAQQAPPQDPGKTAAKPACGCCAQTDQHGKDAASGQATMACCHGKDSKDMACCSKAAKDNKEATPAMTCCDGKGSKDAKMCASKDGKSCCGKDATTACNSKEGKDCCAAMKDCCSAHASGK